MRRANRTADVVVIGGGVIGCSIAYELAKRGIGVSLIERDALGSHSTGKNAGGVRQQFSRDITVRIQMLSLSLLESLEDELGVNPELRRIGYLFVLTNEVDAASFVSYLSIWKRVGLVDARWVSPEEVCALSPAIAMEGVIGGTFCPSDGVASPADVTYAYAGGARRFGAQIFEGCELIAFQIESNRVRGVATTIGAISCDAVFICAGAWSGVLGNLASVDIPVQPYRRHIFLTGPVAGVDSTTPMTVDFASSFYFHPEAQGTLFGMSDQGPPSFNTETDPNFLDAVSAVVSRRAPAFLNAEIRTGWAGLYENTPDFQPILGPVDQVEGLWCACGFSGHGFMQAPAVGLLLAEQFVTGQASIDLSPFAHSRFAGEGLPCEQAVI
jgi:sarcosine oxidase subunit beta